MAGSMAGGMAGRSFVLRSLRHRPSPFAGVRRRLVAWNIGVLCAVLLVVAAAVYVSQSRALAAEVDAQLASQARHELASGHLLEDLAEPPAGTPASASAEEDGEPYEASESPNIFSLLVNDHGQLVRRTNDVQTPGLPDMASAWPVLRRGAPSTLTTLEARQRSRDEHFRLYTVPVLQGGHVIGALQVGTSLAPRYAELRQFLWLLAVCGGAGVLLMAAGGVFLAERALVPARMAFERQRRFVGDASHELRTPLSLMRAEAETLLRALQSGAASADAVSAVGAQPIEQDTELAEMARDLVTEVDYMTHLVHDLLQLARMDRGSEALRRERVALGALAERTCRAAEPLAAERGLRLVFRARAEADVSRTTEMVDADAASGEGELGTSGAAPTLGVWGDQDRLRQILLILLDNALRYTPAPGVITVACWGEPSTRGHPGETVLEVADTGPGIAPEHLPRLFDRFYRVDKARAREQGGSGLGLAIADGIARAHGGRLTVRSTVGIGTTFQLRLPAAAAATASVGGEGADGAPAEQHGDAVQRADHNAAVSHAAKRPEPQPASGIGAAASDRM